MDKLKLNGLGERLKMGGSQMSRMVSGKMKEILQVQTQAGKMVDEATSERLEEPDWGMNLRICALLNSGELSGTDVVTAIKKKIGSKNSVCQRLSLDLLETCAVNCDKVFSEVASEKVLDEMVRMIDNPQTHYSNRQRALELIRAWGESSDELGYLPVFHQTYMGLRARGKYPVEDAIFTSMDSVDQQSESLPTRYPNSIMEHHNGDQNVFIYHGVALSAEKKKEILMVARNSIELLSTILNSEPQHKLIEDELTMSMLEKCRESQPVIQRIIETTGDDEALLFEALNLHEELQLVVSKYEEAETAVQTDQKPMDTVTCDVSGSSSGNAISENEAEKLHPLTEERNRQSESTG